MRKNILTIICALYTLTGMAQTSGKSVGSRLESRNVKISIAGGMNVSTMVGKANGDRDLSDRRIGFQAGVNVDVPLKQDFYLRSGLVLAQKGLKTEGETMNGIFTDNTKITGTPCYLEIPILGSYQHSFGEKFGVQLNTGPYLACGICGKLKWRPVGSYEVSTQSIDWFGDEDDENSAQKKRFDAGWHVGAALMFKGSLSIGYAFEAGFVNSSRIDGVSFKTRCHMINLGFRL